MVIEVLVTGLISICMVVVVDDSRMRDSIAEPKEFMRVRL